MKTLNIKADRKNLHRVLAFIDRELFNAGCRMKTKIQIDIAAEELFTNIAAYAYEDGPGDVYIDIDINGDPPSAVITFSDSGKPFDPFSNEDPDITLNAEERSVGGLGVYMVKKTMDEVHYEYSDGMNHTTIRKMI